MIDDVLKLHFLREVVGDEGLREFIGRDGVEQIQLVDPVQGFLQEDGIVESEEASPWDA